MSTCVAAPAVHGALWLDPVGVRRRRAETHMGRPLLLLVCLWVLRLVRLWLCCSVIDLLLLQDLCLKFYPQSLTPQEGQYTAACLQEVYLQHIYTVWVQCVPCRRTHAVV